MIYRAERTLPPLSRPAGDLRADRGLGLIGRLPGYSSRGDCSQGRGFVRWYSHAGGHPQRQAVRQVESDINDRSAPTQGGGVSGGEAHRCLVDMSAWADRCGRTVSAVHELRAGSGSRYEPCEAGGDHLSSGSSIPALGPRFVRIPRSAVRAFRSTVGVRRARVVKWCSSDSGCRYASFPGW